jgi:hypothetical protein
VIGQALKLKIRPRWLLLVEVVVVVVVVVGCLFRLSHRVVVIRTQVQHRQRHLHQMQRVATLAMQYLA